MIDNIRQEAFKTMGITEEQYNTGSVRWHPAFMLDEKDFLPEFKCGLYD